MLLRVSLCVLLSVTLMPDHLSALYSDEHVSDTEEVDASKCSEEYENCGVIYSSINVTDSMIVNATTGEHYDELTQKKIKVRGFCCEGLICKHEGYEEEPLEPGVTYFCADPENDINRERMFDKWKKSLEMPPNYSY
uniref:Secreted protein n=1 Tax=Graphocephala atropunctata TaxID=36148 RepID=A0A1B6L1U9_9HEMI